MVELVFVHVPKNAGISFLKTLTEVYGEENCKQIWDYLKPYDDMILTDVDGSFWSDYVEFRKFMERRLENVDARVLFGHMPAWCLEGLFPEAKRVTWLREPIDQVLSRVFHYRKMHIMDAHLSDPWALAREPWFRNAQFFYTGGLRGFTGIVEHYSEDLERLAKLLGWPNVEPYHEHRTEHEDDTRLALKNDGGFCAEMRRLNYRDFALYGWAKERRRRALETV